MKTLEAMNPAQFFLEITQDSVRIFNGTAGLELPLERQADARLTEACKNSLVLQLRRFIDRKGWQPRARVFCAIGARGVSLRRLSLPASSREELQRLLPLQIESEFPLPPEQLAWGYQLVGPVGLAAEPSGAKQELLVAAVRKVGLEEFAGVLLQCGATPIFTLAALARSYVCPQPPTAYSVLNVAGRYSELITIDGGVPATVRVLAWGRENLLQPSSEPQGNGRPDASALLAPTPQSAPFGGGSSPTSSSVPPDVFDSLVSLVTGQSLGRSLYVTGLEHLPADLDFAGCLARRLGNAVQCHPVALPVGAAGSAAILGLQRAIERDRGGPPLVLRLESSGAKIRLNHRAPLKLAGLAAGLLLLALLLPYAEAVMLKTHLAKKLAAIKTDQGRLAIIDHELDFLQYLKENEPPYVDALLVLSRAAPPGTRLDSVSMNRRGDVSLRGSFRDGQQVADFRSKLIDSGFFGGVSIEEQAPTPDRQKVNIRITTQWKPVNSRATPTAEPVRSPGEHGSQPAQAMPGMPSPAAPPPATPQMPGTRRTRN